MRQNTYFISDLHLGATYLKNPHDYERRVVRWLHSIKNDAKSLYLMGDILDYWYEYRNVVPRGYVRFLGALAELVDSGVEVTWFIGNHDIWIFDYLPNEIGVKVVDGYQVKDIDGKRFFLSHGDGLGKLKFGFKIIRSVFRNRFCQWLFSAIHPRWTVPFAHRWSSHSRNYSDEKPVFENPEAKKEVFYISDDAYYLNNGTPVDMADYYGAVYEKFNRKRYLELMDQLGLPLSRKISTFSKGMKKQVSILLGVCAGTKYLLCDETFDGLDPVMRQAVKSIFAKEITERGLTPVLASHNLRELEDICDHVGLLHKGGVLLSKDLEEMRTGIHKLQCVFTDEEQEAKVLMGLEVVNKEQRGRLKTLTVRGTHEEITARVAAADPVFFEMLPLTLEEIFISETEVAGYDFKKLIL